jgi:hypothetical protein
MNKSYQNGFRSVHGHLRRTSPQALPPLPSAFTGPYIELRANFLYNMRPPGH